MNKVQIMMAIFTIATIGVKTQIVSVSVSTCQPTTNLALYGFTFNAANVVNNGTCKNYYSTNGACVPSYQLINTLNTNNNWLFQTSLNANSYALQYINATIYFQTVNGWITTSTTVDNSNSSFSSTIGNFFKSLVNRATSLFNNVSAWIKSVFNNTASQINPCFQAWANITNGAYCVLTSSSQVSYQTNAVGSITPVSLVVDPTTTGNALSVCAPLIDTYCSLTYGVSTTNSNSPFNVTFNWSDGGLSLQDCNNFKANANCTTSACTASNNLLYVNLFLTNWVKFVPSSASITNLGNFLTANPIKNSTSYQPVAQTNTGVGIALLSSSGSTGENVYSDGLVSGQSAQTYGSAFSICGKVLLAMLALLI